MFSGNGLSSVTIASGTFESFDYRSGSGADTLVVDKFSDVSTFRIATTDGNDVVTVNAKIGTPIVYAFL